MMNRSKIDWTDFSWNPITGCRHPCQKTYCYAYKQSKRFCGDIRLNKTSPQLQQQGDGLYVLENPFKNVNGKVIPLPVGFEPTLHKYRLSMPSEKLLPANIFVGSMADVFGQWVPLAWIRDVLDACEAALWHNYMFLTKNTQRYKELEHMALLPNMDNFWFGATVTNQDDWDKLTHWHSASANHHWFLSLEPLHGPIDFTKETHHLPEWVIIGSESGRRQGKIVAQREWVESIVEQCRAHDIPVFMKRSEKIGTHKDAPHFMEQLMGSQFVQEYPKQLITPAWEHRPVHKVFVENVRDKKSCRQCGENVQGKSAWRISARFYICANCYKGGEYE